MRSSHGRPLRRLGALAVAALLAGGIGVAEGDDTIVITQGPVLAGTAQVGETLAATGAAWFPPGAKPHWQWLRCDSRRMRSCAAITGATDASYVAVRADRGSRLRAGLEVTSGRKVPATATTEASVVVVAAAGGAPQGPPATDPPGTTPPPKTDPPKTDPPKTDPPKTDPPKTDPPKTDPPKTGPPKKDPPKRNPPASAPGTPAQTPPAPPGTSFTTTAPVTAPVAGGGVKHAARRHMRALKPFPRVRVKGVLTVDGARISRLVVKAPRRARVRVRCSGRGCPARRWSGHGRTLRVRRMQGEFRRGTRITVLVTRRGYVGKRMDLVIRRGRAPLRRDRCVAGNGRRYVACPR